MGILDGLSVSYWSIWFLGLLFWPTVLILAIIFIVKRVRSKKNSNKTSSSLLIFTDSPEEELSQWFVFLGVLFFGGSILFINEWLGQPLEGRNILLLMSIAGFFCTYYFKAILTLIVAMLNLITWVIFNGFVWNQSLDFKYSALLTTISFLLITFYIIGRIHSGSPKINQLAKAYLLFSTLMITGLLFILSSNDGSTILNGILTGESIFTSWKMTSVLSVTAVGALMFFAFSIYKKLLSWPEILSVGILFMVFTSLLFINACVPESNPNLLYDTLANSCKSTSISVLFNLVLFLYIFGIIITGYIRRSSTYINYGAITLFLFIFVKYFDWFFDSLDKSIFFIIAGLILFGVGWFMEKGRKIVISNIKIDLGGIEDKRL